MPQSLTLAVSQSRTLPTTPATLSALSTTAHHASTLGIHLLLFPEAYLGGYPLTCAFGSVIGSRSNVGRDQYLHYYQSAIDFGDTIAGAGQDWVERRLEVGRGKKQRGDGTREELEAIARGAGVFLVVGAVERVGGSLYCAVVYVCPREGCLGKRRKVMPTGIERLIWAQGSPSTLRAITTTIAGVRLTLAAAICWENYMPLLRFSLYSQNVNLYLAPTADARETWLPLMQTIACEGRAFVLSANQCVTRKNLPDWIKGEPSVSSTSEGQISNPTTEAPQETSPDETSNPSSEAVDAVGYKTGNPTDHEHENQPSSKNPPRRSSTVVRTEDDHEIALPAPPAHSSPSTSHNTNGTPSSPKDTDFISRGGSCIISPNGTILAGPLWEIEDGGLLCVTVDFEDCARGRLDLDVAGSYSRSDAFELRVRGLDINPPDC